MKKTSSTQATRLSALLALYEERREAIQGRLRDFSLVPPSQYFYELVYCLMTPQSSAEHAEKVVSKLRACNFAERYIDPEPILRSKEHYIRFHRTKSGHIVRAKEEFLAIASALSNGMNPTEMREWLVTNVKGLGYKEATHYLRNIGRNGGLAILDRHILRNLKRFGVIRTIPDSISKKQYLRIETKFAEFSKHVSIPIDELDLLFWSMETGKIRK